MNQLHIMYMIFSKTTGDYVLLQDHYEKHYTSLDISYMLKHAMSTRPGFRLWQ